MEINIDRLMSESGVGFGTSGARGLVAGMNDFVCFAYTLGFLQHAAGLAAASGFPFDRIAVGYDLRESSPRIARAVFQSVRHFGLEPVDCGTLPTPALVLYGMTERIPSIMITGSHIPEDRNGIKFHLPGGEILKDDEAAIRRQNVRIPDNLFGPDRMFVDGRGEKPRTDEGVARRLYIERFVRALPEKLLAGCRIGLYEHSSVARDILFELYTTLGAKVVRLGRSDRFIAIDTEAVRDEDIALARHWASGNDLPPGIDATPENPPFDAILSTDGDGDRPLLFDEHGGWLRGDIAGILTARFLTAGCVVTPVSSSTALERCGWFKKIVRTRIGSPYVVEAMQNAVRQGFRHVVGYEANGGFLTADAILVDEEQSARPLVPLPTRDPAIVHIAALCYARQTGMPLSGIEQDLPRRVVMSDRLRDFPPELAKQKLDELNVGGAETIRLIFASFGELQEIDKTDGIRMTFGDGDIVHLRPSGNAPELRCYTEADTRQRAESLLCRTMTILDSWRRRSRNETYPYLQ